MTLCQFDHDSPPASHAEGVPSSPTWHYSHPLGTCYSKSLRTYLAPRGIEREVRSILPDAADSENWRALARVWDFVLSLQDRVRDAQWLGQAPEDRWNVLRYSRLAQAQGIPRLDQVM